MLQIKGEATLVGIEHREGKRCLRALVASNTVARMAFYLDYIRPSHGHKKRGVRALINLRKVKHFDALKGCVLHNDP